MKLSHAGLICGFALAMAALIIQPPFRWLDGLSLDTSVWLRHVLLTPAKSEAASHVAVVAIDEETYRRPPFSETPQATWTPLLAPVIRAIAEGDAAAIGFDIVYSTSMDSLSRGFEREFLITLRQVARSGKLVLGKVQHSELPILPHAAQQVAVGGGGNIRALNVFEDPDGIIRRVPLAFKASGADDKPALEPAFAAELTQRKLAAPIARGDDGRWHAGGRLLPTDAQDNILLRFDTAPGAIPTYSLADLLACSQKPDPDYFRRHFAGRVVIFATVLDVEDRRLTSKRLATTPDGLNAPDRCALQPIKLNRLDLARDSIPGVYIHATAINNLIDGTLLRELPLPLLGAITLTLSLALAFAAFLLPLPLGIGLAGAAALALPVTSAGLLGSGVSLAWAPVALALGLTLAATVAFRIAVTDRDKRLITKVFSLYLPASVIDRMVQSGELPALGGEEREVTILFSDIAGFTGISEACEPAALVQGLNDYFSEMTAIIEAQGGFVDKFIGDAIVAVFGAPAADPQHAEKAVEATLQMQAALTGDVARFSIAGLPLRTRIGLNTAKVLIGNIGSPRRFNYTVMGDGVNLASRLEGANKKYGTAILVSDATRAACGDGTLFRSIDRIRVVGRDEPVTVFEPLAHRMAATPAQTRMAEVFSAAQAALAARDLDLAERLLRELPEDPAAAAFLKRLEMLRKLAAELPPSAPWPPVTDLSEK